MNLAELHLITGWFRDYKSNNDRIKLLKERFNINSIVVTNGGEGAILDYDSTFHNHSGYSVKVEDTVGSGDAFLAGIVSKLIDRAPPGEVLDFASMLGAFVASKKGACPNYTLNILDQMHSLKN